MSVIIRSLVKTYGTRRALDEVSFEARPGAVLGFLGPNGAGKSTTMKIAVGIITADSGTVEICGTDIHENALEARRKIGYLPENNPLYYDMYVREYLEFSGGMYGLKGSQLQQRIADMLEITGLEREKGKKIGALSKGYKQRVGLAHAMIHDPEVLFLDEPTSGLDPNQITEIRDVIKNVGKEKTVIFSTHIMQEVSHICSRVVIINKGRIVANESVETLNASMSGAVRYLAEFATAIDANLLRNIQGVAGVVRLSDVRYEIHATAGTDIRAGVFEVASTQNTPLLEMTRYEKSLEELFRELTEGK